MEDNNEAPAAAAATSDNEISHEHTNRTHANKTPPQNNAFQR